MNLCDNEILNLISAANDEQCDCYISPDASPRVSDICGCAENIFDKTVVILSGRGIMPTDFSVGKSHPNVMFQTSSALSDLSFWEDASDRGINGIVLLNAETAKRSEYGFMRDYQRLGDIRAGMPKHIGLIAVFSGTEYIAEKEFLSYFGSKGAVTLGKNTVELDSEIFTDNRRRTNALSDFLSANGDRTAVLCSTRRDAENLSDRLTKDGIKNVLFHGGLCEGDKIGALIAVSDGTARTIIATKSILQYTPFLPPLKTVCCGVPYSLSHASRITALSHSPKRKLTCFYCSDDVYQILKISRAYAENYTDDPVLFMNERRDSLLRLLKKII